MFDKKKELATTESTPLQILAAAIERDIDTDKLKELMALEREWRADKAKAEYAIALTKFASLKKPIKHNQKGKTAGNTPFSYADYPAMVTAIDPWLSECGLSHSHIQDAPTIEDGKVILVMVTCVIKHISGHSEPFSFPAIPDEKLRDKLSPSQLLQLAITYAKRQTLAMGLGLATMEDKFDDDSTAPPALIIDEQVAIIENLIKTKEADKEGFCLFFGVESIADLPAKKYHQAHNMLKQKKSLA